MNYCCPHRLLTNVVVKRVLVAAQVHFIDDDRTQSIPKQSGVNIEVISSFTCIISTAPAPAADVLTPSLLRLFAFILLRSRHLWCFSGTIRLLLRSPFQPYAISEFGIDFLTRIG
ncbi:uncharacterized protein TNCV_4721951 [Trichonephila clavipes]|uniref:Uncharacterized protein n=1 Tax=Trichonephila clavipes TaxID=2585209 RepID=A0A8X6W6T2_TRICX|nr:uncharacterized protein TNCV_4721951 [Trichonephila clavipes]